MGDEIWLTAPPAVRLRVGPAGVLLGRDRRCDVILADPRASRHHALVRTSEEGPVVVALGRHGVRVNEAAATAVPLAHGDRIEVPGLVLTVEIVARSGAESDWFVTAPGSPPVRVARAGFALGAEGDLAPAGWPRQALVLTPEGERLSVVGAVGWRRNGFALPAGEAAAVRAGDVLEIGGVAVAIDRLAGAVPPTSGLAGELPERVELEFLARGGRLRVAVGGEEQVVWLAERRFALVMSLLAPAPPARAGEDLPDEVVIPAIWPRQPHKSRVDLNVLVARVRRDLEAAGLSPAWIARAEGGGGTRFRLAPGAVVRVASDGS